MIRRIDDLIYWTSFITAFLLGLAWDEWDRWKYTHPARRRTT